MKASSRSPLTKTAILILLCIAALGFSSLAYAGGAFITDSVNKSGTALRWQNDTMEWYVDAGKLSTNVENAEALDWITDAVAKWMDVEIQNADRKMVKTSTIEAVYKGKVEEDINVDNCVDFVTDTSNEPRTVIIFDDDGQITSAIYGAQNATQTVGLSQPLAFDSAAKTIKKGVVILNGLILAKNVLASTEAQSKELFKAAVIHEIGHLLNLDHSQVNFGIAEACKRNQTCADGNFISTMYPTLKTPYQYMLSRDDEIAISWIYPTETFTNQFCTIVGDILDAKGNPLKQVNVLATRTGEGDEAAKKDVRSFVSGALVSKCDGDSKYYLHGIVPNRNYQVTYEALGQNFSGGSGFEPIADQAPPQFTGGVIQSKDGATTVACANGGETIEMSPVKIDVQNPCTYSSDATTPTQATSSEDEDNSGDSVASTSKCSLSKGVSDKEFASIFLIAISFGLLLYVRRSSISKS